MTEKSAYAAAGVDTEAEDRAIALMTDAVRSTYGPEVLWGMGAFGGLFDASRLREMRAPVLVGSTDSVGTKTVVGAAMGSYHTLGMDIVNHCINDILVQGAEPLFFLDYIAMPVLDSRVVTTIVEGVAEACREARCAILGGETAELPGVYAPGQLDLVGAIVGVVERDEIIDGSSIVPGDLLVGLPSSGVHTNGFSLVRSIFPSESFGDYTNELGRPLGEALVEPHRSYLPHVRAVRQVAHIKGLAHLTGGGSEANIPRILPEDTSVIIDRSAWQVPPLFQLIERVGQVDHEEMYRVFNMGIGMVMVLAADQADAAIGALHGEATIIGKVVPRSDAARVELR
ncbi:MAG: phosphoribosylformylglycinamidine cyclo-ligase [Chloroflexi bacterium RBG_13_56_8]|nr:MAG: phosphoribosylformylglycinamidine cyclo-ligase [Chloroflexi bacterium RBG_13_56_8]